MCALVERRGLVLVGCGGVACVTLVSSLLDAGLVM